MLLFALVRKSFPRAVEGVTTPGLEAKEFADVASVR